MKLSIVIVNYHNPPLLRLSLTTLARALGRSFSYEVLVVDSSSTIETQNVVRHDCAHLFERIVLVPFTENTGYTRGVNEGLRRASGEYILILNPDVVMLPGTIESMMSYIHDHQNVGLLGPKLLNFDGTRQDSCFRFCTPLTIIARRMRLPFTRALIDGFLMHGDVLTKPTPVDWIMGSALMTTKKAIEHVGYCDKRFFHYMSDVDWAKSFWENGYKVVYYPNAQAYHYHQRLSKGKFGVFDLLFERQTHWHINDAFRYFLKHGI